MTASEIVKEGIEKFIEYRDLCGYGEDNAKRMVLLESPEIDLFEVDDPYSDACWVKCEGEY
jgi:hypothetical protein